MLDRPSLGRRPLIVHEVFRIIASPARTGVSILLVEAERAGRSRDEPVRLRAQKPARSSIPAQPPT